MTSEIFEGWRVVHQVGGASVEECSTIGALYEGVGVESEVVGYIESMGEMMSRADLMVGRCGAGTVGECWSSRLPAIFLPYPYHKDEHQKHNASAMVEAGCAVVCGDRVDARENLEAHGEVFGRVLGEPGVLEGMREGFGVLGDADGAVKVARMLMSG